MSLPARRRYILTAVLAYVVLALAWIFLSDRLLTAFIDLESILWYSTAKGVFFVLVSGAVFYLVLQAVPAGDDTPATLPGELLLDSTTLGLKPRWLAYLLAVTLVVIMLVVRVTLMPVFAERPLLIIFILPIILAALLGGFGPGLAATFAAGIAGLYSLPPYGTFGVAVAHDLLQWSLLIVNGLTITLISEGMRRARQRERLHAQQCELVSARLKESEERYRTLFENSLDAVLLTVPNGQILKANSAACRLFGRTEEELCDLGRSGVVDADDPHLTELLEERARTGRACGELVMVREDGSHFPAEVSSVVFKSSAGELRTSMFIRDITTRKRAEAELREKEVQYRNLADAGLALIWTAGTDKLCNYFNRRWLEFTGRTLEQELGNGWAEGVHPEDFDRCLETYVAAFDRREPFTMEYRLRHADGDYRWIFDMGTPNYDSAGEFVGYIGHCFDITEKKQAEQERQRLIAELKKRNSELERFTYTVSHDLKSPLVTILGFIGQLEHDLAAGDRENVKADLDFIGNAAGRMRELLDSLLQLSRAGRALGEPVPVEPATLAREMIEQLGDRLAHATLRVDIPADLPVVMGDPVRLRGVFQNLLENAAKFTAGQAEPCIEIGCTARPGELLCHVRDNGIGVPPQYQEKIFGLFEQLDPNSGGTGIGLAIVRRIVEEHGGRVWVESAGKGQGSTFWFTLPVSAAAV